MRQAKSLPHFYIALPTSDDKFATVHKEPLPQAINPALAPLPTGLPRSATLNPAAGQRADWGRFAVIVLQFGIIVALVDYFQIGTHTLARLLEVTFAGFAIHHVLPLRFRLPFFASFSLASVLLVTGEWLGLLKGRIALIPFLQGLAPGCVMLLIGLTLIGMCHLPIGFGARVGLLITFGAGLTVIRANTQWFPPLSGIWAILGSMFVFRLMVYLYDLKHRTAPFSPARSIAYFFMIPNVCFPLFPLVDYKTFCTTYYNEDWERIYQTGLIWMIRGVFHLLLYRLVYQYAPLDAAALSSATDVAGFVLGTYLLYLRISGQFHLIVGILHMFGFNLPETHHLYLLASSFTDFWRRINIYWKDFIMKLFFYPAFFKLRKLGTVRALVLSTLATFFATWLLHSWQWFWIRGSLLFTWQDVAFWTILALLVLVNALYENKSARGRSLTKSRVTFGRRLRLGLQTIGTFLVICTLWTVWSCRSLEELLVLADAASRPRVQDLAIILSVLAVIGIAGMIWGQSSRDTSEGRMAPSARRPFHFWRSATAVGVVSLCLVAVSLADSWNQHTKSRSVLTALRGHGPNTHDLNLQRRGYYEELDLARLNYHQWRQDETPKGWNQGRAVLYHQRGDFLSVDFNPSVSGVLSGEVVTTNPLGMRDREYSKKKPAGAYRMLLVGASHEIGLGVKDDETFENLVEDHLNRARAGTYSKYEILNLSVGAADLFQKLARIEQLGFDFEPDAVLLSVYEADRTFILPHLSRNLRLGIEAPPEYREFLSGIFEKAGVRANMPDLIIQNRLRPYMADLFQWVLNRYAQQCAKREIRAFAIYRPHPQEMLESAERQEMLRLCRSAGLEVLDLSAAFDGVADRETLILADWDTHTNASGHRLLAEELYDQLVSRLGIDLPALGNGKNPAPANEHFKKIRAKL